MKTPEEIADEIQYTAPLSATEWENIIAAINADRAQRTQIYIVQGEGGDVVDVFWDGDEAEAANGHRETRTIIADTPWESGDYARWRLAELKEAWSEGTMGENPDDYALTGEDWFVGLGDWDDANEAEALTRYLGEKGAN